MDERNNLINEAKIRQEINPELLSAISIHLDGSLS